MTRKVSEEKALTVSPTDQTIQKIDSLTPAVVVGVSNKITIADELLPEEFRGVSLETIDGAFSPSVKWEKPGNFAGGLYQNMEEEVGPHDSRLYNFLTGDGRAFCIWGSKSLDAMMDNLLAQKKVKQGTKMLVIYMGGVPTEKGNDCKLYQIKIAQ